ncbi:hypothetical protein, partial [Roseovarius gahaiensis]|uniref:hypothetical protein n=1 Tax=Roseovarius gahaiensis TaxID=2716691 RepID=UPI001E2DEE5D
AHNLKVVGSNPTPATNYSKINQTLKPVVCQCHWAFCVLHQRYINTALEKPDSHVLALTGMHRPALDGI